MVGLSLSDEKVRDMDKLTVAFITKLEITTAIEHLRVLAPLKSAGVNVNRYFVDRDFDFNKIKPCQVIVIQRDFASDYYSYQKLLDYAKRQNIPVVLDLDDNLLELPLDHPDRKALYYTESLLPLLQSMIEVDAITVTNHVLQKEIQKFNPAVFVLPNYLDDNIWQMKAPKLPNSNSEIKMLFMGSHTHRVDLDMIAKPLELLLNVYPFLKFYAYGIELPKNLKNHRRALHIPSATMVYTDFANHFRDLDMDIAIAPLVENKFNDYKSPLKFFEYSAIGVPGVYSNVGPFARIIEREKTGLLADNIQEDWIAQLETLIKDNNLRYELALNAQEKIRTEHLLSKNARKWLTVYKAVLNLQKENNESFLLPLSQLRDINLQITQVQKNKENILNKLQKQISLHIEQERKFELDITNIKTDTTRLFNEKAKIEKKLEKVESELKNAIGELDTKANTLINTEKALKNTQAELNHTLDDLSNTRTQLHQTKNSLEHKSLESAVYIRKSNEAERVLSEVYNSNSWKLTKPIRKIMKLLSPRKHRDQTKEEDIALIKSSSLFDSAWYLNQNPDVAQSKLDPLEHFYLYGGVEGRSPSESFDSAFYIESNYDVKLEGINPLIHYLKYGKSENRQPKQPLTTPQPVATTDLEQKGENMHLINKAIDIAKNEGIVSLIKKGHKKLFAGREFQNELDEAIAKSRYDVSIIIPAYNAVDYTIACIEKVYSVRTKASFEVIVVDNDSHDDTQVRIQNLAKDKDDFSYYRLETNRGFAGGVNFGFTKAEGRYLVILNNDTLPTDDWLDLMIAAFEADPTLGIVSPMTNYVGEGPQLDVDALDIQPEEIDTYALTIRDREFVYEPNRLVFFCVMIRKSVVDQIGLLDEGYIKGNFEDDDYNMRAILSGYKLGIVRTAFVYHHGSITFAVNKIGHSEHMELNRKRFYLKAGNLSTTRHRFNSQGINPLISVIVRTLNRPDLLTRALTSLSNQSFKQFEVVLINDGGEDVQEIVDTFSCYFPINYVYHKKSKGRTPALNAGVANASAKWIAVLDDDDIVYPWHFETLYNATLEKPEYKMFYTNYNRTIFRTINSHDPLVLRGVEPWPYNKAQLWVTNRIPMHTWLLAKACFEKVGFFDEAQTMLEDFEFLVRLTKKYDFFHINRVTCEYRFYLDGINSMINNRSKTLEALEYIYKQHPSKDKEILNGREIELKSLANQITKIESEKKELTGEPANDELVIRRITKLILGF